VKSRPAHADDCPGCDTGWVWGDLLCPRCASAVQKAQPSFYTGWLAARAALELRKEDTAAIGLEAFQRGLIVGTARLLHKPGGNRRNWAFEITPKGHAILEKAKKKAKA